MDTDAKGQVGGMDASEEVRRRFAAQSKLSRCAACGKTNDEIIKELDEVVQAHGGESKSDEQVPEQLRLAYREDLDKEKTNAGEGDAKAAEKVVADGPEQSDPAPTRTTPAPVPVATFPAPALAQQQQPPLRQDDGVPAWIDKAIYGVLAALAFLLWKKYLL
jgi:ubiquitin-conjugating enzyme E2 J1